MTSKRGGLLLGLETHDNWCGQYVLKVCFLAGNLALGATQGLTKMEAMARGIDSPFLEHVVLS